jgi:hypothetical protein
LLLAACFLDHCGTVAAHDIPADATVQVFVKPAGQRLQLLVRVPLKTIRDLEFPERADGYLDVEKLSPQLPDAAKVWIADFVAIQEGDARLPNPRIAATQLSLESDRSFASFDAALDHVTGPKLSGSSHVVWNQLLFDVLLEYPIQSDRSRFSIRPGLERFAARVVTVLRFLPPGGAVRAYEFTGDPGMVPLDPRWHQAALGFIKLGFFHILDGTDHLLFLLCLVIPLRRLRPLLLVVTAFTVAHSITLIASAYGIAPDALWFPPLIETLIAVSIVYMALRTSSERARTAADDCLRSGWSTASASRSLSARNCSLPDPTRQLTVLQYRRRTGPTPGIDPADPGAAGTLPFRRGRAYGNHHPVRAGGPHRLALDVGTRRHLRPLPAASF